MQDDKGKRLTSFTKENKSDKASLYCKKYKDSRGIQQEAQSTVGRDQTKKGRQRFR